jgi:hypothetical protein
MRLVAVIAALAAAAFAGPAAADSAPCDFDLVSVPLHPSSSERIGLRLMRGLFFPGAGPGVARATLQSGTIALDVVQTRERDAFPGYSPIGDMVQDVFAEVGPLAPGAYPVTITVSSFVDGVTNVPCDAVVQTLRVGATAGPVTTLDAIEFYNTIRDRYFLTADDGEIGYLDHGGEPGWVRTGGGFKVYARDRSDGRGYIVNRFLSPPGTGIDAHFLTASYRELIVLIGDPSWHYEPQPFDIGFPDTLTGDCASGMAPVYRLFNPHNGDHRFTTDAFLKAGLEAQGWVPEGYGDRGVAMCSPLV